MEKSLLFNLSSSAASSRISLPPSNCFPTSTHLLPPALSPKNLRRNKHSPEAWLLSSDLRGRYGFSGQGFKCSNSGVSIPSSEDDLILLDVDGMLCGGCTSSVKKILESQQHVINASVFLESKSAEVKVSLVSSGGSKREIGEALAKHLSNCGFTSRVREIPA